MVDVACEAGRPVDRALDATCDATSPAEVATDDAVPCDPAVDCATEEACPADTAMDCAMFCAAALELFTSPAESKICQLAVKSPSGI